MPDTMASSPGPPDERLPTLMAALYNSSQAKEFITQSEAVPSDHGRVEVLRRTLARSLRDMEHTRDDYLTWSQDLPGTSVVERDRLGFNEKFMTITKRKIRIYSQIRSAAATLFAAQVDKIAAIRQYNPDPRSADPGWQAMIRFGGIDNKIRAEVIGRVGESRQKAMV